jgi:hypothetical protein
MEHLRAQTAQRHVMSSFVQGERNGGRKNKRKKIGECE